MSKILVVDDTPFWRDVTADALRLKGHEVVMASDGVQGLAMVGKSQPDLIILDVEMPEMPGLKFLEQIRSHAKWKLLPVIMLTGAMQKEQILCAKKFGAAEYLLKSNFSMADLLGRVQKRLASSSDGESGTPAPVRPPGAAVANQSVLSGVSSIQKDAVAPRSAPPADPHLAVPHLTNREVCIERAKKAMAARTLPGAIAQVMSMAASPRAELNDISALIARDPILSARMFQIANTPAHASKRGVVTTIPDAVRNIGRTAVRDIAGAMGVFDAMPPSEADGFNPIRSWQHSFAVANLCARLAPDADAGTAYLVGLCHDLGEILFRSHFGPECQQIMDAQKQTGRSEDDLEREMLGITRGQLVHVILQCLGLPETILQPIDSFHDATFHRAPAHPMAKILHLADLYATGMLLTPSEQSLIRPLTRVECKNATAKQDLLRPDSAALRAEVFTLTAMLSRASSEEAGRLLESPFPRSTKRIFLSRDASLSAFDPIATALESLADLTVLEGLPTRAQLLGHDALVVLSTNASKAASCLKEIRTPPGTTGPIPVLWLAGKIDQDRGPDLGSLEPTLWPIPLASLAGFVRAL